jgi:hypothetical protein
VESLFGHDLGFQHDKPLTVQNPNELVVAESRLTQFNCKIKHIIIIAESATDFERTAFSTSVASQYFGSMEAAPLTEGGVIPTHEKAIPSNVEIEPAQKTIDHALSGFGPRNSLLLVYIAAFLLGNRNHPLVKKIKLVWRMRSRHTVTQP